MLRELHLPCNVAITATADRNCVAGAGTLWTDLGHCLAIDSAPVSVGILNAIQNGLAEAKVTARDLATVGLTIANARNIFEKIVEVPLSLRLLADQADGCFVKRGQHLKTAKLFKERADVFGHRWLMAAGHMHGRKDHQAHIFVSDQ